MLADYQPDIEKEDVYFEKEFILWGLTQFKKLSKYRKYNNYLKKIFFDDNKLAANKFNNIISKIWFPLLKNYYTTNI